MYKRQAYERVADKVYPGTLKAIVGKIAANRDNDAWAYHACLLYTSDAADERSSVDLGGRRIIKKKTTEKVSGMMIMNTTHTKSTVQTIRDEKRT